MKHITHNKEAASEGVESDDESTEGDGKRRCRWLTSARVELSKTMVLLTVEYRRAEPMKGGSNGRGGEPGVAAEPEGGNGVERSGTDPGERGGAHYCCQGWIKTTGEEKPTRSR